MVDCQSTIAETCEGRDELTGTSASSASRRCATSKSRMPGASSTGTAGAKLTGELFASVARMMVEPRRKKIERPSRLQRGLRAAAKRDANAIAVTTVRVDIRPSGFIRHIREPRSVGRPAAIRVVETALHQRCWRVARDVNRDDVASGSRDSGVSHDSRSSPVGWRGIAFDDRLVLGVLVVRSLHEDYWPSGLKRPERYASPVRRPDRIAVRSERQRQRLAGLPDAAGTTAMSSVRSSGAVSVTAACWSSGDRRTCQRSPASPIVPVRLPFMSNHASSRARGDEAADSSTRGGCDEETSSARRHADACDDGNASSLKCSCGLDSLRHAARRRARRAGSRQRSGHGLRSP